MPLRSLLLGLLLSLALCALCYANDTFLRVGMLVTHLLPAAAYGGLVLAVLVVNPLLRLCGLRPFRGRELAVVLGLFLIACGLPDISLGKTLSNAAMWPLHLNRITPSWSQVGILGLLPQDMFCDLSLPDGDRALNGFVAGLAQGSSSLSPAAVPWRVWLRPALFWSPLVFSLLLAVFGLALVFHRQWSDHEQLPYPIVQFASSLLPDEEGRRSPLLSSRLFWVGFAVTLAILLNNYAVRWFPKVVIPVQLRLDFVPFAKILPTITHGRGWGLFGPQFIFTVIGLAYFLPSEASLSMWLGPWLFCLIAGVFAAYGVQLRSGMMMALAPEPFIYIGSYIGLMLVILYAGRQFYLSALRRSLGLRARDDIPPVAVFGMRLFLASAAFFAVYLHCRTDVHWTLGLLYVLLAVTTFAVVSRVLAETGAFEVGTVVYPGIAAWGFFGESAVGPSALITLFMLSVVLLSGPGWSVMPFLGQALRLTDRRQVPLGRFARWGLATMLLGVLVCVPATLYWQYDSGSANSWGRISTAFPANNGVQLLMKLRVTGLEETALSRSGLDYLLHASPYWPYVGTAALSCLLAVAVAMLRLRFAWWPLHPCIFIFFGGDQSVKMSFSFGVGFLLKWLITRFGGGRLYQTCKPLFIGLIAGTVAGQLIPMLISAIHFACTGQRI